MVAATLAPEFVAVVLQVADDIAIVVGHPLSPWCAAYSAAVSVSLARATISIEAGGSELPNSSSRSWIIPGNFARNASFASKLQRPRRLHLRQRLHLLQHLGGH